jgi:hypothetical protein
MKVFGGLFLLLWGAAAAASVAMPVVLIWAIVHFVLKFW